MDLGTSKIKNSKYWDFIEFVSTKAANAYMGGSDNFTPSFEHAEFLTGVPYPEIYADFRQAFKSKTRS